MVSRLSSTRRARLPVLAATLLLAVSTAGCLKRSPDMTGSLGASASGPVGEGGLRERAEELARRNEANPTDPAVAIAYAATLRSLDQRAQAVAVLQQAAIRNPKHLDLLGAYGKALADAGRLKEASDVLGRAHLPENPDWRILSAQGTVADQMGDHARAQQYYQAALRIAPGEATVMSNLGLSLALSKRLPEAERTLVEASARPKADLRVRQNLALVLGLQGKLAEAETVLKRDMPPAEAAANMQVLRGMISQQNSWAAIRQQDGKAKARTVAAKADD